MDFGTNPCIRCGKERVKHSEKNIVINSSNVKVTIFVCPDKECQKVVEKELAAKETRRLELTNRRNFIPKKTPATAKT